MKYLVTFALFGLSALCLVVLAGTPYNPGIPQVIETTKTETIYLGSNAMLVFFLVAMAVLAGVGGLILGGIAIESDKSVAEEEIRSRRR